MLQFGSFPSLSSKLNPMAEALCVSPDWGAGLGYSNSLLVGIVHYIVNYSPVVSSLGILTCTKFLTHKKFSKIWCYFLSSFDNWNPVLFFQLMFSLSFLQTTDIFTVISVTLFKSLVTTGFSSQRQPPLPTVEINGKIIVDFSSTRWSV